MIGGVAGALQQTPWQTPVVWPNGRCLLLPWQVPKRFTKRVHTPARKRLLKRLPKRLRGCFRATPTPVLVLYAPSVCVVRCSDLSLHTTVLKSTTPPIVREVVDMAMEASVDPDLETPLPLESMRHAQVLYP